MAKQRETCGKLDDAIDKTFPASDPITVGKPTGTEPAQKPVDRAPPLITKEDIEAAQRGEGHAQRDRVTQDPATRSGKETEE